VNEHVPPRRCDHEGRPPGTSHTAQRFYRDGYVEFKRAYYSAPPEYVGRQVWVRQEIVCLKAVFV